MKKEKSKNIMVTMPQVIIKQLNELAVFYGETHSGMIRRCISEYYNVTYRKQAFGYQAGHVSQDKRKSREARATRIEEIRAMDDASLTAHLIEIGYVKDFEEISKGIFISFSVYTQDNGSRFMRQEYRKTANKEEVPYSTGDAFSLEALIKDLEKEKML